MLLLCIGKCSYLPLFAQMLDLVDCCTNIYLVVVKGERKGLRVVVKERCINDIRCANDDVSYISSDLFII